MGLGSGCVELPGAFNRGETSHDTETDDAGGSEAGYGPVDAADATTADVDMDADSTQPESATDVPPIDALGDLPAELPSDAGTDVSSEVLDVPSADVTEVEVLSEDAVDVMDAEAQPDAAMGDVLPEVIVGPDLPQADGSAGETSEPCVGGCDDGVTCTVDVCGDSGCSHVPDHTACSDGNACTADLCDVDDGCTNPAEPRAACEDDDPCTTDACVDGACVSTPIDCSELDAGCLVGVCGDAGDCELGQAPDGTPCDDGIACTGDDVCSAGSCGGTQYLTIQLGGDLDDQFNSASLLPNGGLGLIGSATSAGGVKEAWLVVTSAAGVVTNAPTFVAEGDAELWDLAVLSNGALALVGSRAGAGTAEDGWLIRTDANGQQLLSNNLTFGGEGIEVASSVVVLPNGNLAIAGFTTSIGAGAEDFWLVFSDDKGNPQGPEHAFGTTSTEIASDLLVVPDSWVPGGGLALLGFSYVSGNADWNLVLTTFLGAQTGETLVFGGPNDDTTHTLTLLQDGSLAAVGGKAVDNWLLVLPPAGGDPTIDQTYPGSGLATAWGLAVLDSGFALAGQDAADGAFSDGLLVRTDATGAAPASTTFGGEQADEFRAIVKMPGGALALVGFTTTGGQKDGWVVFTDPQGKVCGQ